jgi:hypothetical protein
VPWLQAGIRHQISIITNKVQSLRSQPKKASPRNYWSPKQLRRVLHKICHWANWLSNGINFEELNKKSRIGEIHIKDTLLWFLLNKVTKM